jgi:hypothetical protein
MGFPVKVETRARLAPDGCIALAMQATPGRAARIANDHPVGPTPAPWPGAPAPLAAGLGGPVALGRRRAA